MLVRFATVSVWSCYGCGSKSSNVVVLSDFEFVVVCVVFVRYDPDLLLFLSVLEKKV